MTNGRSSQISLQNVSKHYKTEDGVFFALKDASLEFFPGEYVAIVGPSGSGKSTLMHLIGLLDRPSSGKITLNQKDISKLSDEEISKLRNEFIGFVFQQFNLIPKLTVLENILLPTIYTKNHLSFDPRSKALGLVKRFNIAEKIDTYPNRLSGGQQQRVAIARSLIMNPNFILADEPTGNLDTKTGNSIIEILEELNQKDKVTVVLVTHEENVARRANRLIKIRDGGIVK